jgi:predicted ATP-grasp superfamily ATP-dependent carboligase
MWRRGAGAADGTTESFELLFDLVLSVNVDNERHSPFVAKACELLADSQPMLEVVTGTPAENAGCDALVVQELAQLTERGNGTKHLRPRKKADGQITGRSSE